MRTGGQRSTASSVQIGAWRPTPRSWASLPLTPSSGPTSRRSRAALEVFHWKLLVTGRQPRYYRERKVPLFLLRTFTMRLGLLLLLPVSLLGLLCLDSSQGQEKATKYPTLGKIEKYDPRLDDLVPPGAVIEKIADGQVWTEGVCWIP